MSQVTGFTTPEVNGTFNAWCGGCFPLTDPDGNGIFTGTATIPEGPHQFKFAHDTWSGQESLTSGSSCTITTGAFTNRLVNVQADVVLPVFCYGQCSSCGYAVSNDSPYSAVNLQFSGNTAYPNCYTINGTLANATDSPQSADFSGKDLWYKIIAQSTAVSVTLSGSSQDDAIAIYEKVGSGFQLMSGSLENAASGDGDFERLNYSGLTPGNLYYISIGSASGSGGGAYTMCLQHLMPSTCTTIMPAGGFNLCSTFKAAYRGAASQGVGYTFHFTPTGSTTGSATSALWRYVQRVCRCSLWWPYRWSGYRGAYQFDWFDIRRLQ
jgi:hypothetical protein